MNFYKFFLITTLISVCSLWVGLIGSWFWLAYEPIPNEISTVYDNLVYDYIIVGGGTAGCVLANRLSQNESLSVLLIEAGRNFGPLSILPVAATAMQGTNVDWSFRTTTQKHSSKGLFDNQQFWPRGKGLGGSSQLNYMLHFSGDERDFNAWESTVGPLWGFNEMRPYLDDACGEDATEMSCSISDFRDRNIAYYNELSDFNLARVLLDAGYEFEATHAEEQVRVDVAKYNIKRGQRHGAYHQYLKAAFNRANLHILTNTRVHKILFANHRATSVLLSPDKMPIKTKTIEARREIILSAGAIVSPQILKLSGIGPRNELIHHGINIIHDSPQVGRNLFDHLNFPVYVSIREPQSATRSKVLSVHEWYKYLKHGRGVLSNPAIVGQVTSTSQHHGIMLFGMGSVDESVLRAIANFKPNIFRSLFPFYGNTSQEGFIFLNTCYQPVSRGSILLRSSEITSAPRINPNYLAQKRDVSCMRNAIRLSVKMLQTVAFKSIGSRIHWPKIKACSNFGPYSSDYITHNPSNEYFECIIRHGGLTAHHSGGTCAMGRSPTSVLDEQMRVRGVTGLRVVDASAFPLPVSGTPNSIVIALALRASEFILNEF